MHLWLTSKDQFRKKYYSTDPPEFRTPYTDFGKEIAETLEDKEATARHPVLSKIPAYEISEYQIEHEIEGVPIKAYLDSFCPYHFKILEYKTSVKKKNGKPTWNSLSVRKHDQLLLYSLLVKDLHGHVDPITTLVWMETEWGEVCKTHNLGGKDYKICGPQLQLTGHFEIFDREIRDWEHDRMKALIKQVAEEITEDYTHYKKNTWTTS